MMSLTSIGERPMTSARSFWVQPRSSSMSFRYSPAGKTSAGLWLAMSYRTSLLVVVLDADDSEHLRRTLPSDFEDEPKLVVKADRVLMSALARELFKVQPL